MFYKATDSHIYSRYDSDHPVKCKDSIQFSQIWQLRRLSSDDEDFANKVSEMSDLFLEKK